MIKHSLSYFTEYEYIGQQRNATNPTQAVGESYQTLNRTTMEPRVRRPLPPVEFADAENVGGHVLRAALDMVLLWRSSVRGENRQVTARSANQDAGPTDQQQDVCAIIDCSTTNVPDAIAPVAGSADGGPYQSTICAPISANEDNSNALGTDKNGETACAGASGGGNEKSRNQNEVGASADPNENISPDEEPGVHDSTGCDKQDAVDRHTARGSPTADHIGDDESDEREDNDYITVTEGWDGYEMPVAQQP